MDKVDKNSKTLTKTFGGLKTILAGVASLGFGAVIKSSIDAADALGKVANKVGLSVKALQELRFVADQAGISSKTLDTSMQRFSRRVGEAANDTGVLRKDLDKLGISIKNNDGSMRNIKDVFLDYTDAMRGAGSEQERLRLAIAAFDMAGGDMVNMLGSSREAMVALGDEASRLAPLLTQSQVDAAVKSNDAWAKVKFQFRQIALVVSSELAPGMEALATSISKILANEENIRGMQEAFKGISEALKTIASLITSDLISLLFDVGKWLALGLAVKAFAGSLRWAGKILAAYKTAVLAATASGVALNGSLTLGAIAGKKFFSAMAYGLKIVGWTALLGFLLDMKGSLVSLTSVFGSADKAATGFFDNLHQRAIAWEKSDAGILDTIASGIRGITDATSGGLVTGGIDALLGKDFGRPVDIRPKIEGYTYNSDVTEESKAAGRAEIARLDAQDAAERKSFKLKVDLNSAMKQQISEINSEYKKQQEVIKARNEVLMSTVNSLLPLRAATDLYNSQINDLVESLNNGIITQEEYNKAVTNAKVAFDSINPVMIKAKQAAKDLADEQIKYVKSIKSLATAYNPVLTQEKKFIESRRLLNEGVKKRIITEKQYNAAIKNLNKEIADFNKQQLQNSRKWSDGWKRAMDNYVEDATNAAKQAEDVFKTATQGMEDAIVGFAKTGKFEWKSFLDDIVTQMLRSQIKQTMASVFQMPSISGSSSPSSVPAGASGGGIGGGSSSGGSSSSGFWGSVGSFFGGLFADGGNLGAGKWGIAGEAGPEIISGPASITPMSNGQTAVTYNINAVDAQSFKQMIARDPKFLFAVTEEGRRNLPQYR